MTRNRSRCSSRTRCRPPDAALSESAVLESQDKQLATEITRDQAALAAQLRARRGGGRGTALPPIGNINVVSAGGIYVNAQIADNVSALLDAAQADGVPLAGWGYRDTTAQIALRQAHCGSSRYRDLRDALLPVLTPDRATRARRCTSAGWRSTSPTAARRSAATAARDTSGWLRTPRSTASTTCRRSPGTGRRTGTRAPPAPDGRWRARPASFPEYIIVVGPVRLLVRERRVHDFGCRRRSSVSSATSTGSTGLCARIEVGRDHIGEPASRLSDDRSSC